MFRTPSDGTCLNSRSSTLRINHDGVSVLLCLYVHSFHIESCNSTPRPSCIEMRGWWHEDRGMHTCVKILCHAPFLLSVATNQESTAFQSFAQYSGLNCKQRLIRASQWIFAQGNPNMHHSSSGAELRQSLACMLIYCFPRLIC